MTDHERDTCRAVQDRWLALPVIASHIRNHGDHERIAGPNSPTFADVRRCVLPGWQEWFRDFWQ